MIKVVFFDKIKTSLVKKKIKSSVNDKLSLDGKFDTVIDSVSDTIIEKVGVDNIIKANDTLKKLNKN